MRSETPGGRPQRPAALAEAAFVQLRADLLASGPLTTGRRLVAGELARQLGVSRTPVREALDRLARLGYLTSLEGGGYERRRYRTRDVRDLYELRLLLEPFAAELAAQARADGSGAAQGSTFHVRVAHASGNRVLAHVIELVSERLAALRVDTLQAGGHKPDAAADEEAHPAHERIRAAIRKGDGVGARAAMTAHLASQARGLIRSRPDGGDDLWAGPS